MSIDRIELGERANEQRGGPASDPRRPASVKEEEHAGPLTILDDDNLPQLPKARRIALVITLTGASFLNVRASLEHESQ